MSHRHITEALTEKNVLNLICINSPQSMDFHHIVHNKHRSEVYFNNKKIN